MVDKSTSSESVLVEATVTYEYRVLLEVDIPSGQSREESSRQYIQEKYGDILAVTSPHEGADRLSAKSITITQITPI